MVAPTASQTFGAFGTPGNPLNTPLVLLDKRR